MGPERGMTVADLIEHLQGIPPHFDVRLDVSDDHEVPLSRENIQRDSLMQNITIAPVPADMVGTDGDRPRKLVIQKPTASPSETPTAQAHEGPEHLEVHSVVFCRECRRVFMPGKETRAGDILPCGHTPCVWMVGSNIVTDSENSEFIEWARSNGELDDDIDALEDAGGRYDPQKSGPNRLVLPRR